MCLLLCAGKFNNCTNRLLSSDRRLLVAVAGIEVRERLASAVGKWVEACQRGSQFAPQRRGHNVVEERVDNGRGEQGQSRADGFCFVIKTRR